MIKRILFNYPLILYYGISLISNICFYAGQRTFVDHLGSLVVSRTYICQRIIIPGEHMWTSNKSWTSLANKNICILDFHKFKWNFKAKYFFSLFVESMACLLTFCTYKKKFTNILHKGTSFGKKYQLKLWPTFQHLLLGMSLNCGNIFVCVGFHSQSWMKRKHRYK